jgi:ankyrin repeat protein
MPARVPPEVKAKALALEGAYKIIMKQKNTGLAAFTALINTLSPADLSVPTKSGRTLLEKAIDTGSVETVKLLIQKGINLIRVGSDVIYARPAGPPYPVPPSNTYLTTAASRTEEIFRLILDPFLAAGGNLNHGYHLALVEATGNKKHGQKIVELLLERGADINRADGRGSTPLYSALSNDNKKLVDYLIVRGADVTRIDEKGQNLLFRVIPHNDTKKTSFDSFKLLLSKGLDINKVDNEGNNILSYALKSYTPLLNFIKFLFSNGIHVGPTPMICTYMGGSNGYDAAVRLQIIDFILSKGETLNTLCNGSSPLAKYIRFFSRTDAWQRPNLDFIKACVARGADVNIVNLPEQDTLVHICMKSGLIDVAEYLIKDTNYNLSLQNAKGLNAVHFLGSSSRCEALLRFVLDKPEGAALVNSRDEIGCTPIFSARSVGALSILLEKGADINHVNTKGHTAAFYYAYFGYTDVLEAILNKETLNKAQIIENGRTLYDIAKNNERRFTEKSPDLRTAQKVIQLILTLAAPNVEKWKGFSRPNVAKFDDIFDDEAAPEYSSCPICLKYVQRSDGCVYIQGHKCAQLEGFYHKRLYDMYKNEQGIVTWCTLCGRISHGHRHYALGPAQGDKPKLEISHDPFTKDCRNGEGGGGLPEKVLRYRRIREYARDLQEEVGKKAETLALEELVEEAWNAPMTRIPALKKILEKKEWNIPSDVFPLPVRAEEAPIDFAAFPNIQKPAADAALLAPTKLQGMDSIMGEIGEVIQFHHRLDDGTLYHHVDKYISADSLELFIAGQNGKFKSDESFGRCWAYPGDCMGKLYPEDIRGSVPNEMYNEYRQKFNWRFRARAGGSRKTRRNSHKHRHTHRHKGGFNVFVEATNAQCYTRNNYKKNQTRKQNSNTNRNTNQ